MIIACYVDRDAALRGGRDTWGWRTVDVPAADIAPVTREILVAEAGERPIGAPADADYWLPETVDVDGESERPFTAPLATRDAVLLGVQRLGRLRALQRETLARWDREAQARVGALRAWALEHGSPLLRARTEEGLAWQGLARQEYADAASAAVELAGCPRAERTHALEQRDAPTLREIVALRGARAQLASRGFPDALVAHCRLPGPRGPAPCPRPDHAHAEHGRNALAVTVPTPDGGRETRLHLVPEPEAADAR